MSDILYGLGIAGVLFGPLFLYIWWKNKAVLTEIQDTEMTDILNIKHEGPVEVSGTVKAQTTHQSPIEREESVLSSWFIEEWDETGDHGNWYPIAQGIESETFEIEDDTGTITVDLDDAIHESGKWLGYFRKPNFNPLHNDSYGVAIGSFAAIFDKFPRVLRHEPEDEPPEVEEFVDSLETINQSKDSITNKIDMFTPHGERRYSENNIQEGDHIYLLGQVQSDKTEPLSAKDATITNRDTGPTIISNMPEEHLKGAIKGKLKLYSVLGLTFTVAGTAILTLLTVF